MCGYIMTSDADIRRTLQTDEHRMNSWLIRELAMDDAAVVSQHRYFRDGEQLEDLNVYSAWLLPRIADGRYVGRVALADGKVVGGAGVLLLDWGPTRGFPSPLRGRIVNVFTEPNWRRRGIAKALVTSVITACEGFGVRQFCLGTTPLAQSLYQSLGFVLYEAEMVKKG